MKKTEADSSSKAVMDVRWEMAWWVIQISDIQLREYEYMLYCLGMFEDGALRMHKCYATDKQGVCEST